MAYGVFAEFYDELMRGVDYGAKADYICKIIDNFHHIPGLTLDLACGTGTLTLELKSRGMDIYGADASFEMLAEAKQKAAEKNLDLLFLCQKMQTLDLFGTINTCVCTLDSINHLKGERQVRLAFERVSLFMEKEGLFIFDVNTPYKHAEVLGNNTFVYDTDSVYCVWQNTYSSDTMSVDIDLDFFIPEGKLYYRCEENFTEYAYPIDKIKEMLDDVGFDTAAVYADMTFDSPAEDTQRVTFVAVKRYDAANTDSQIT